MPTSAFHPKRTFAPTFDRCEPECPLRVESGRSALDAQSAFSDHTKRQAFILQPGN
jgi:hypothetical protein